jgi:hypothetical protein
MEGQVQLIAGRKRRFQLIDGVEIAGRPAYQVERAVELHLGDGLRAIGNVDLRDRLRGLVLQHEMALTGKGPVIWIKIDVGVGGDDFWLR